jgi:hopene-associated glycosyltransferase HpnB
MIPALVASALAAVAWAYLLACHGGFWLTGQRLPDSAGHGADPPAWPAVTAVIPARNEAAGLPGSLPSLLAQQYPGALNVVLVDDESTDGTGQTAALLGRAAGWAVSHTAQLSDQLAAGAMAPPPGPAPLAAVGETAPAQSRTLWIAAGRPRPPGWAGKVWAMSQGMAAAPDADYLLFTDADIAYGPGTVTALVQAAVGDRRALVSQMALLRAAGGWERVVVPAFVYFFAQLYPFRRVNRRGGRTAAAAGGCMLVRREALAGAGGLASIRGARIDDVALGRLLKQGAGADCWLGLTTGITSTRPYDHLADLWGMVARSAYTQLRYSPALLAGTVLGLAWLYLLPPAAAIAGVIAAAAGGAATAFGLAGAGLAGWVMMTVSYVPMLRLYRLSPLRALGLPLIALLYAAMTADSARRHHAGRGGEWKGRIIQSDS